MLFDKSDYSKKQGNIGEACAIYEYTKLGFTVCKPLCDSAKYDLIVEKNGDIRRVQVRTTSYKRNKKFEVNLKVCGGNKSGNTIQPRTDSDYDELFVLTSEGSIWIIPCIESGKKPLCVESSKFDKYRLV